MVYQYAVLVARILGPTMGSDGLQRPLWTFLPERACLKGEHELAWSQGFQPRCSWVSGEPPEPLHMYMFLPSHECGPVAIAREIDAAELDLLRARSSDGSV
jgi:hypothetical protein